MTNTDIRDVFTDAIRYWERRRILYNAILLLIVVAVFIYFWPASASEVSLNLLLRFFMLAVIANVLYCAAYIADFVAQFSGFRSAWQRYRWVLFAVGTAFAGTIARFTSIGAFDSAG